MEYANGIMAGMETASIYATPRVVETSDDCYFYHAMDVPGHPEAGRGPVDLRAGVEKYLGRIDVRGKRVLEIGTTDGYLAFHLESKGAQVVAYDLSERYDWDDVPYGGRVTPEVRADRRGQARKYNNAFWFNHRAFQSQAQMVHGTVYGIPEEIGPVDVVTFGAILIHLRDPFLALENALRLTRETVVITETTLMRWFNPLRLAPWVVGPYAMFLPNGRTREPEHSWWLLTPALLRRMLGVLGFEDTRTVYHYQTYHGKRYRHYTIVARRTQGEALPPAT